LKSVAKYESPTVGTLIDRYEGFLVNKGNKRSSISTTLHRLRGFFGEKLQSKPVETLTTERVAASYRARCEHTRSDTNRNELAEMKTFFRWVVEEGHLRKNIAEDIKPTHSGKRTKGKRQFRPAEAKLFLDEALAEAGEGNDAGLACAAVLLLGLRPSEITRRVVRDVDPKTRRLFIEDAKTESSNRQVEIPDVLWPLFEARIADRAGNELLLPNRDGTGFRVRAWVNNNTKRMCRKLGLPVVVGYSLRGCHSTLATEAGTTAHVVSRQLGHADGRTTREHYIAPGAIEKQERKTVLKLVSGER